LNSEVGKKEKQSAKSKAFWIRPSAYRVCALEGSGNAACDELPSTCSGPELVEGSRVEVG
jgi:hypothetical protein